ncbi:aldo/keto reductase [Streptomyces sp. MP131-18]|uniref:aldo/keto reductase n=1 Tax=Streptomyces sp. MP131-18 TaxID=1857892 RepID=UPI00097BEA93|nr:aldo/keto reductase [Streptomyces sp. MP131-18]ONK09790.1 General stress protein 69 [Streptomyces sp. MP131-18]
MRYTRLGRTALQVSELCLGSLNLGVRADDQESHAILDTALAHGINFVDTANQYGWQKYKGYTEEFLGSWFALGGGRREKIVLSTKVGNPMDDWPNESGLSARHIIASCDASLRRLKTDWIDLFQMHHVDRSAPWDEVWQAMEFLTRQGKVRYVGSSNFAGWHIAEAQENAARRNFLGIVSEQSVYNLVTRHIELEVIPACLRYGVAVLPWSPLHGGLLSGVLRKLTEGEAMKSAQGRAAEALETHRETLAAYEDLCAEHGLDPAEVGLAWTMTRPGVTAPVIGPRSVAQLESALRAAHLILSDEVLKRLDALFPPIGKGGPGPEAWAW